MLAFHCLLLVLLAGQASADENKCQAQKGRNPVCITEMCQKYWPTKTDLNPAELMEAQKRFFDKDTFFDEWIDECKLKQQPQIGECTIFKQTTEYRATMNEIVDCKPWGNDETWCLCGTPNDIPAVQNNCPQDPKIEKRFNSAGSCGGKALGCDSKSLYDVEHIIDRNGHESIPLDKGALDMYGNVVMAWGAWNQELGGCAKLYYDKMQAEKKMIYGELWDRAVLYTTQCNKHKKLEGGQANLKLKLKSSAPTPAPAGRKRQVDADGDRAAAPAAKKRRADDQLDTQPSPGMSNAALVHASLSDINGTTPLGAAAKNGHVEVVNALLASGQVNPNEPSLDGRTPLFKAAENGHFHVVHALLASGQVDPNEPSLDGRTPLFKAAENGHFHVVGALLAHQNNRPTDHTASGSGSENGGA